MEVRRSSVVGVHWCLKLVWQVRSFNAATVISSQHFHVDPISNVVLHVILWFEVRLIWVHQLLRQYNIHKYTSLRLI